VWVSYRAENHGTNFTWSDSRSLDCDVRSFDGHIHEAYVFACAAATDDSGASLNPLVA
jgi:hypothetical protein